MSNSDDKIKAENFSEQEAFAAWEAEQGPEYWEQVRLENEAIAAEMAQEAFEAWEAKQGPEYWEQVRLENEAIAAEEATRAFEEFFAAGHGMEFGRFECLKDEHLENLARCDKEIAEKKVPYFLHEYMVADLMPLHELHIIAGESGAGKSTWLFQFIDDWQRERPILGKKSTWYPFIILVQDRTKPGVLRTLQRMGLHPKSFPVQSGIEGGRATLKQKIEACLEKNPDIKIFFVEGLHVGMDESNDYGAVSRAIRELIALCQARKITIVATTHMSKLNAADGNSGRGAILGSSAAPAMSEANILLNKMKPNKAKGIPDGAVKLTAHGRNEAEIVRYYRWEAGRLVEFDPEAEKKKAQEDHRFLQFLNEIGDVFTREDLVAFYERRFKLGEKAADKDRLDAQKNNWIEPCVSDQGKEIRGRWKRKPVDWKPES